jgi:hypothetical protein
MGDAVAAAIITAFGSIVAAVIMAVTTTGIGTWRFTKRLGYLLVAIIAAVASLSVYYLLYDYDRTASRLEKALLKIEGYKPKIYANIGLGFVYPQNWQIEDYGFRFGGGEIELVRDRSPDGLIETQGMTVAVENIAEHHWGDPQSQFEHIEVDLREKCNVSFKHERENIANGHTADVFRCSRSTSKGGTQKQVDERLYLYQLSKCVRLRIESWTSLSGAPLRTSFDEELKQFLQNMRLDIDKNTYSETFCVPHAQAT